MADATDVTRENLIADRIISVDHGPRGKVWSLNAQPRAEGGPYLRLHFAMIYVSDTERSLRFFRDQLGFDVVADVRFASGHRWVEVAPPDGTASLAIVLPRPGENEEPLVGKSSPISFLTEDVGSKSKEWIERGVMLDEMPDTSALRASIYRFQNPDGNRFILAGFDEVTLQIEEHRRASAERQETERRAAQEMEVAKQVQARLFPQQCPPVHGLDYGGVCRQARAVGGDYYDFFRTGPEQLALVLGDIAGKGIAAALLMANLQASLRSQAMFAAEHLEEMLAAVNRLMLRNTADSSYATLFFADFDSATSVLRYANCGHLPGLVLRSDGTVERLHATSTVIGLFEDWQAVQADVPLFAGDILALYTDGVTESFDESGDEFGEERLVAALRRSHALPASELAEIVVEEVIAFSAAEQFDDVTLVIAKLK